MEFWVDVLADTTSHTSNQESCNNKGHKTDKPEPECWFPFLIRVKPDAETVSHTSETAKPHRNNVMEVSN